VNLFYTPGIEGERHVLGEDESKHAVRVLRLKPGDPVVAVDGRGGWHESVVMEAGPKKCVLEVRSVTRDHQPLPYTLHLAVSPTKSTDRFEWFLEKATEIGITEITPLICHRTERTRLKYDRLERIIVSAMKQSLRAYKPVLNEAVRLEKFVALDRKGTLAVAHCMPGNRVSFGDLPRSGSYTLMVGPEGDFTADEVDSAVKAGYLPFHLGQARLRTETAAVHVVSAISLMKQSS